MKVIPSKIFAKQIDKLIKSNPNIIPSINRKINLITRWLVPKETVKGYQGIYKTRVWKYRLAYKIKESEVLFLLVIGKRENVYKILVNLIWNIEL